MLVDSIIAKERQVQSVGTAGIRDNGQTGGWKQTTAPSVHPRLQRPLDDLVWGTVFEIKVEKGDKAWKKGQQHVHFEASNYAIALRALVDSQASAGNTSQIPT